MELKLGWMLLCILATTIISWSKVSADVVVGSTRVSSTHLDIEEVMKEKKPKKDKKDKKVKPKKKKLTKEEKARLKEEKKKKKKEKKESGGKENSGDDDGGDDDDENNYYGGLDDNVCTGEVCNYCLVNFASCIDNGAS